MATRVFQGIPEYNSDMLPTPAVLGDCKQIEFIVTSYVATERFSQYDRLAKAPKELFHRLGWGSLICLMLLLVSMVSRLFLAANGWPFPEWIGVIAAIVGALGVALTVVNAILRPRDKWLHNRFIAERIRQWKFQRFLVGSIGQQLIANPSSYKSEQSDYEARFAGFMVQFAAGIGNMRDFLENMDLRVAPVPWPKELTEEVKRAYLVLRLDWQRQHFLYKANTYQSVDEWTDHIAKMTLVLAAALCLVDAAIALLTVAHQPAPSVIVYSVAALSIASACTSGVARALRQGLNLEEEQERYRSKAHDMDRLRERFIVARDPNLVVEIIQETERKLEDELREFVNAVQRASFLL